MAGRSSEEGRGVTVGSLRHEVDGESAVMKVEWMVRKERSYEKFAPVKR